MADLAHDPAAARQPVDRAGPPTSLANRSHSGLGVRVHPLAAGPPRSVSFHSYLNEIPQLRAVDGAVGIDVEVLRRDFGDSEIAKRPAAVFTAVAAASPTTQCWSR